MKLIALYILRALGVSLVITLGLTVFCAVLPMPTHYYQYRLSWALIMGFALFVLQILTMPLIVWQKHGGKHPLTAQRIHDEQFLMLEKTRAFFRRHRGKTVTILIVGLLSLVLIDSFTK